jgi:hypothetical protein
MQGGSWSPQGSQRESERKNVQVQPGKLCSYLVEMKRFGEGRERGATASRQREAIHGGVMKDEKQRREHEWIVYSSPKCEEKMMDFKKKEGRSIQVIACMR